MAETHTGAPQRANNPRPGPAGGVARRAATPNRGRNTATARPQGRRPAPGKPTQRRTAPAPQRTTAPPQKQKQFTDLELEQASQQFETAFGLLGLVADGHPVCPECGKGGKNKVVFRKQKGYWKCHRCGAWGTLLGSKARNEPGLLEKYRGYSFVDSVNALLGRPVRMEGNAAVKPIVPTVVIESNDFQAVVDMDVYDAVIAAGSVEAAQRFFGRWHIDADVVAESGAVVVEDVPVMLKALTERFGRERLIASGLVKEGSDGRRDIPMISAKYPVVEPHRRPDGRVVGMQFRASEEHEKLVKSYDRRKAEYDATKATYESKHGEGTFDPQGRRKPRYQPKFMSLVGGIVGGHLVGCGIPRIARLEPGQRVYIVEGFKDYLAARTLGVEAYAIPGVGVMPPPKVLKFLARHTMVLCMDADEGGERGVEALTSVFDAAGVAHTPKDPPLPDGFDVTDELVNRRARRGCDCQTCVAWRASHPTAAPTGAAPRR